MMAIGVVATLSMVGGSAASAAQFFSASGSITAGDPTQAGRLSRDPPAASCAAPITANPLDSMPRRYDLYTFDNLTNSPICVTVTTTLNVPQADPCDNNLFTVAYLPSFDPSSITSNFAGHSGGSVSVASGPRSFSFTAPPGPFAVDVHQIQVDGLCSSYAVALDAAEPFATARPSISGTATEGQTLTGTHATWSGTPALTEQWRRCDSAGASCTDIPGATGLGYNPSAADTGSTLRLRETASQGGQSVVDSAPTEVVKSILRALSVGKAGSGSGFVTGTGIECGADCAEGYSPGAGVTLTATPDASSAFAGWSGCDDPSGNACRMSMDADKAVVANFELDETAPDTVITEQPKDKVKARRKKAPIAYEFEATEPGSTFACSLDGKPFSACTSPLTFKAKRGRHSFAVLATDRAGNVDGTPATDAFRVKLVR